MTMTSSKPVAAPNALPVESVAIRDLKKHPRNYRQHPEDQLEHLVESLRVHGFYRNVVVAKDNTILAGHGVVEAAKRLGHETVPVIRLYVGPNDPRALKVLTGDNEIAHLGEIDDRLLSELLKDIKDTDIDGLLGTGYDEQMLANLVFVTRPAEEIRTIDEAAEWVGMPEYEEGEQPLKVVASFRNEADRDEFLRIIGAPAHNGKCRDTLSLWWPHKEKNDLASVQFQG